MRSDSAAAYRRAPRLEQANVSTASSFAEWVGSRSLLAPSTNAGATPLPFQSWHRFKEAFSPELVAMAVEGSARKVRRLCDPFGGSGTTSIASQFMGIESVSIEVNPFLADLIDAKVTLYDVRGLIAALPRVARRARRIKVSARRIFADVPPTFIQPGIKGRWLFDTEVASEVGHLRESIHQEADPKIRRLFTVLLGGMLVEFSNAVVSGKGRRYRKGWQNRRANPALLLPRFCDIVANAIVEIDALSRRPHVAVEVIRGDSRKRMRDIGAVDLLVCSPPYPNSFDYTDVYNIELWMLGYLHSPAENQRLRRSTLSSHVQIRRKFLPAPRSVILARALKRLDRVRQDLWDENLVEMVGGYFADLHQLLDGCADALRTRAQAWFVVGDSQYAGVRIRVADVLAELASAKGFKIVRRQPFRSMRLSPQQGGSHRLAENLLVFAKV